MYRTSLPQDPLVLVALNRDVFFGVRLRNLAKELGFDLILAQNADGLSRALRERHQTVALVVIDMNLLDQAVEWDAVAAARQVGMLIGWLRFIASWQTLLWMDAPRLSSITVAYLS
jgi:hypothetical protein